jgi:hypothetical protein
MYSPGGEAMSGVYASAFEHTVSKKTKLTTINATAVLTCPATAKGVKLLYLRITNTDATNTDTAVVEIYDSSENASYTWIPSASITNNGIYESKMRGVTLDPSDELRVTASAANDLHVFAVGAQIQGRGG